MNTFQKYLLYIFVMLVLVYLFATVLVWTIWMIKYLLFITAAILAFSLLSKAVFKK